MGRKRPFSRKRSPLPTEKAGALLLFVPEFGNVNDYNNLLAALIPQLPAPLLIEALLLIRARAQETYMQPSLEALISRWDEMLTTSSIDNKGEVALTLAALAKGGTVVFTPGLTAFIPILSSFAVLQDISDILNFM